MSVSHKAFLFDRKNLESLKSDQKPLDFKAGDFLSVDYKIKDSFSERVTNFKGVCTKIRNNGTLSYFVLRKITKGIGVEKTILPYSPLVMSIKVERRGKVRRAVLDYLRNIKGAIKIKERFLKSKKK